MPDTMIPPWEEAPEYYAEEIEFSGVVRRDRSGVHVELMLGGYHDEITPSEFVDWAKSVSVNTSI